jgi:excisionase family DNA binding protein
MKIHYTNLHRLGPEFEREAVFHADARDLLSVNSFLTLHAPGTNATAHFLNAETIELLPPGAVVVNAARGSLVDDDALIPALRSGRIAAAGLDVYNGEPHMRPEYRALPNVFLLPHLGTATIETRTLMGMRSLDNVDAALERAKGSDSMMAKTKDTALPIGDHLLTLREAAEVLRLSTRTVREYILRGEIEARIIGGRWSIYLVLF